MSELRQVSTATALQGEILKLHDYGAEDDEEQDDVENELSDIELRAARRTLWNEYFTWARVVEAGEVCCVISPSTEGTDVIAHMQTINPLGE